MVQDVNYNQSQDLQKILDSALPGTVLRLSPGEWFGKWEIRTPGLTLVGAGPDVTRFVHDDYARKIHADGREYNTFRTWTLAVTAPGVTLRSLAVENRAGDPAEKGQEVALTVYGDDFTLEDCRLSSTQDTLFLGPLPPDLCERYVDLLPERLRDPRPLRSVLRRSLIEGSVDFIFGCGAALLEDCEIRSVPDGRDVGYAAAPAHALAQREGFTFRRCRFTREPGVADGSIYLARPWRDYGLAVFEDCVYEAHIAREGFDKWNDTRRDETARFYERPLRPGRVTWLNRDTHQE